MLIMLIIFDYLNISTIHLTIFISHNFDTFYFVSSKLYMKKSFDTTIFFKYSKQVERHPAFPFGPF